MTNIELYLVYWKWLVLCKFKVRRLVMVDKYQLKQIFDKTINICLNEIIGKIGELKSLYLHHLPKEYRKILSIGVGSDDKLQELISIFQKYIVDDERQIVAKINENLLNTNREKIQELTNEVNHTLNTNFDVEFVYQMFVSYIKTLTHFMLMLAFRCMGIDLSDSNVSIDYGSLGTPGRIAKMWVCKNIYDLTEPLSGRFAIEPDLVIFPAKDDEIGKPVTLTLTINSLCSHHLFRFGNEFRNQKSNAIISYIPRDKVLGLSKINRWVEWVARRGWLQEDLTKYIGEELKRRLNTNDIYVGLINLQHGCVAFRGKCDSHSYTTTEYYSGKYEDIMFRKEIIDSLS